MFEILPFISSGNAKCGLSRGQFFTLHRYYQQCWNFFHGIIHLFIRIFSTLYIHLFIRTFSHWIYIYLFELFSTVYTLIWAFSTIYTLIYSNFFFTVYIIYLFELFRLYIHLFIRTFPPCIFSPCSSIFWRALSITATETS